MSFRRRMVLLAAGAVAAAVVLASVVVYVVTGDELRSGIDQSLRAKATPGQPQAVQILATGSPAQLAKLKRDGRLPPAGSAPVGGEQSAAAAGVAEARPSSSSSHKAVVSETVTLEGNKVVARTGSVTGRALPAVPVHAPAGGEHGARLLLPAPGIGGAAGYAQLLRPNGQVLRSQEKGVLIPLTAATRAVANGKQNAFFSDQTIAGTPVRVLAVPAAGGGVLQVALPLTDVDSTLRHLRLVLALVCLGGIALAPPWCRCGA
jgi:two-component system, OmpR family, sensor histidine kinase MprB